MSSEILVLGAGGHGKVVADAILRSNRNLLGFLDDREVSTDETVLGAPILGRIDSWHRFRDAEFVVAIGDNAVRQRVVAGIMESSLPVHWATVIHPSALIAPTAAIGKGVTILAGAIINVDVRIGEHVIINTGATVDHDCVIGDFAHIAPGANLAGDVRVDVGALIGIGAAIIPGCRIGAHSVVGAGAAVVSDVPSGVTAKGVPARW